MSEIRVNSIKARTGLGTVSVSDDGLIVTGIVTTASVEATGAISAASMSITGNATITGNANIAGVLTYEDVTSVDSVGIITAQAGLRVTAGGIVNVGVATFSSGVNVSGGLVGINSESPVTDVDISQKTGAVALPQGTTAQRPAGSNPYIRFNTTNSALEFYNGTNWVEIITDYFPSGSTTLG